MMLEEIPYNLTIFSKKAATIYSTFKLFFRGIRLSILLNILIATKSVPNQLDVGKSTIKSIAILVYTITAIGMG